MYRVRGRRPYPGTCGGSFVRLPYGKRKKKFRVAFELVYEGWHAESWHAEYDAKREEFSFGFLKRGEFRDYLTDDFWKAFAIWKRSLLRGLPSGKGWVFESAAVLDLLDLFDDTADFLERRRLELKRGMKGVGTNNR